MTHAVGYEKLYRNIHFERRGGILLMRLHVLASTNAEFADLTHFVYGVVPGDSVQVVWPMLLGINRARYFLMTGQKLSAQDALQLGVVSEILQPDQLLARAWELAADLGRKPVAALRGTRLALTQHLKKRLLEELG
jgi:enoyl-CoA hydratase/carnithine racemase